MSDAPQLLVDWEGRWGGFVSSLGAVFSRSPSAERGSYVASGIPFRTPVVSLCLHCALVFGWLFLSPWLFLLLPATIPIDPLPEIARETVYFFPVALPEIGDVGGARSGTEGRSGGRHAHHALQTIRIARGPKAVTTIVDAPKLKLPRTHDRVANLLSFAGAAPAPPVDSLNRSLRQTGLPGLAPAPVAPAPDAAVRGALPSLPSAAQFQPSSTPQMEIRALAQPVPVEVVVLAPPLDQVTQVPKLALPTARTVVPVAPMVARDLSNMSSSWAASAGTAVAPPISVETARSAAGAGGAGAAQPGPVAAVQSLSGAAGHGAASAGQGNGVGGGNAQGLIVSLNPGNKLGIPDGDANGSLAMSPEGRDTGGLGGSGGGGGIARGAGPGSGGAGAGPGSGSTGTGPGANAIAGISPLPGPGGSGEVNGTMALVPGVTVQGNVITIPSFATPGAAAAGPRVHSDPRQPPTIIVIANSRAGGGMNAYGALKGSRVYTTYIETRIGTAVLQYSDPSSRPGFEAELTPPEPMRTQLAADIKSARVIVRCVLEKTGKLRDLRVLESPDPALSVKLVGALRQWLFRPAFRLDAAIDIDVILGFGITTR